MSMLNRMLAGLAVLGLALMAQPSVGSADYPEQSITIVVPFSAGGFTDTLARLVGEKLSERVGQPVVIDNRPGAGGNVAAGHVARSDPDGYTLFIATNTTHGTNPTLYSNIPFDPLADFAPVVLMVSTPNLLVATPSLEADTVAELVELAKAQPGEFNYGSTSIGSSPHLQGELLKAQTGIEMTHIPYRGSSQAITDLMEGNVHVMFDNFFFQKPHVEAGSVKALGITSTSRSDQLPDVPTLGEQGIEGFEFGPWFGIAAPAGTPEEVIEKLNNEVNQILEMPDVRERLEGTLIIGGSQDDFVVHIEQEMDKWGTLIRELDLQVE
jgi:tripartite-type tricarboxylate transporter receptor subunit TctC